jgi:hypothetical protein
MIQSSSPIVLVAQILDIIRKAMKTNVRAKIAAATVIITAERFSWGRWQVLACTFARTVTSTIRKYMEYGQRRPTELVVHCAVLQQTCRRQRWQNGAPALAGCIRQRTIGLWYRYQQTWELEAISQRSASYRDEAAYPTRCEVRDRQLLSMGNGQPDHDGEHCATMDPHFANRSLLACDIREFADFKWEFGQQDASFR